MTKSVGLKLIYALLFCVAAIVGSSAQTFTTLVAFDGANGAGPSGALVQGIDGNLYGTTVTGGSNCIPEGGCGTVFRITPSGELTTIYNFCSQGSYPNCADGTEPAETLVLATDGNFYGTTSGPNAVGGTVYKITSAGRLTTLYSFCSKANCADGSDPEGLVQANGNFYGATRAGGARDYGTIFKISPAGSLATLYNFCSQPPCTDGQFPNEGLVQGLNGNFYGTTSSGGVYCHGGCGTVFEITAAGDLTTLYSFCRHTNCSDGSTPYTGLALATNGNLYGTTSYSGQNFDGGGTVFGMTPAGRLATLYTFCLQTGCADGRAPNTLVQATNGDFFGTTNGGGTSGDFGTLFQITPTGALTTLYSFCSQPGCTDGNTPTAGMTQATNGNFYGTTAGGGNSACSSPQGCGTVFSLSVSLGPFAETVPTIARVGAEVGILGNNLSGTTSVTFNGTTAQFTVKSGTFIEATVPSGATTGYVTVATPSGVLTSNVPFHVIP